jgi:hypothetical protein
MDKVKRALEQSNTFEEYKRLLLGMLQDVNVAE